MPPIADLDRLFSGDLNASVPKYLLGEGVISRLINGRFVKGAITNGLGFDEFEPEYVKGNNTRYFPGNVTYGELLKLGDIQLAAPLKNVVGKFIVYVISGVIFLYDIKTNLAYDITPKDSSVTFRSRTSFPLSYIDNTSGVYGIGGYLVLFNYPNRPIFINHEGARLSNAGNFEMPPSRLGTTAGIRAFVATGDNIFLASDPLGGDSGLAPLTFAETLQPGGNYLNQFFSIGNILDTQRITAICRLPSTVGANSEFLARTILISTHNAKYTCPAGAPRETWDQQTFISDFGRGEGVAGSLAWTNAGSIVIYVASTGRIKTLEQDQQRDASLVENYFDDNLGQYLNENECNFHHRDWYKKLDHSHSQVKYVGDRVYATVSPFFSPGKGKFGNLQHSYSHRALAIGSLDPAASLGPQASIKWEGFYDWFKPVALTTLDKDFYVAAKNELGHNQFFKLNLSKPDDHKTTIITRGYFSQSAGRSKSLTEGRLYFRQLCREFPINVSYLMNDVWCPANDNGWTGKSFKFKGQPGLKTDSWSIPLKIELGHYGANFELESIRVRGEEYPEEKM